MASLNEIVEVNVEVSSIVPITSDFNLGLIISNDLTSNISELRIFSKSDWQTQIATAGYARSSPTYYAVQGYFSQNPCSSRVAVGNVGSNDTIAEAYAEFRRLNQEFYGVLLVPSTTLSSESNIGALAAEIDADEIPAILFYGFGDWDLPSSLHSNGRKRAVGCYEDDYGMAEYAFGLFCGLNSMENNSAYTMAYKNLIGSGYTNFSDAALQNLVVDSYANANVNFGSEYVFFYPGILSSGYHIDEQYMIDLAKHLIQRYVIAGLTGARKIPQTEDGVNTLVSMVASACNKIRDIGLIDSGVWRGGTVGNLNNGEAIQDGYYIYAGAVADMTDADKAARKSPVIQVALHSSGAIEHVVINVYIDR